MAPSCVVCMPPFCMLCMAPGAKPCAGYKAAFYCSQYCQIKDMPAHQLVCRDSIDTYADTNRPLYPWDPTRTFFRAIMFEDRSDKPRFFRLEFGRYMNNGDGSISGNIPDIYAHLHLQASENDTLLVHIVIKVNPVTKVSLRNPIHICYLESSLNEDVPNSSINSLMRELRSESPLPSWRGSVIAYGTEGDFSYPRDIDMQDFRDIADFLNSYDRLFNGTRRSWKFDPILRSSIYQVSTLVNALFGLYIICGYDLSVCLAEVSMVLCGCHLYLKTSLPFQKPYRILLAGVLNFFAGLLGTGWASEGRYGPLITPALTVIVFSTILLMTGTVESYKSMVSKVASNSKEWDGLRAESPGLVG